MCSSDLLEPTLFGYSKGAFTGATTSRAGYFEDARDSTLFLDEIGELPLELQAKLLRVLENGEYQRVGETQSRVSNARVIAATNRDMRQEIRNGRFRADLYHRLSVFTIEMPPLRDLGDDKRLLLDHFRDFYSRQAAVKPFEFDGKALELWLDYSFPGNVRELRNLIERSLILGALNVSALYQRISRDEQRPAVAAPAAPLTTDLQTLEKNHILAVLDSVRGDKTRAAQLLGISRRTLERRVAEWGG